MKSRIDLTGLSFGRLIVLSRCKYEKGKAHRWICRCQCGNTKETNGGGLLNGTTKSCGCLRKEKCSLLGLSLTKDILRQRFGRLVVESQAERGKTPRWNCLCDCGTKIVVSSRHLMNNHTKSCGCLKDEKVGKEHWNWNPSKSDEDRILMRDRSLAPLLRQWRHDVYTRDGFSCQICGYAKGRILMAHHKDGWNWCSERRFDVSNGTTLCSYCHAEFHKLYGSGNNTEVQFAEWTSLEKTRRESCLLSQEMTI